MVSEVECGPLSQGTKLCERNRRQKLVNGELVKLRQSGGKNGRSEYVTQGRNRYLYTARSNCLVAFSSF